MTEYQCGCIKDDYDTNEIIYSTIRYQLLDDFPKKLDLREKVDISVTNQKQTKMCVSCSISLQLLCILKRSQSPLFNYYNARYLSGKDTNVDNGITIKSGYQALERYGTCDNNFYINYSLINTIPDSIDYLKSELLPYKAKRLNNIIQEVIYALNLCSPVVFGMELYESFNDTKEYYVKPDILNDKYKGHHALTLIGYDLEEKYFLIMNSWGDKWGINGCCKITFNDFNNHMINDLWCLEKEI